MTAHSANAYLPGIHAGTGPARGRFSGLLGSLQLRIAEFGRFRRTRRELLSLSERELADIGISSYDIDVIARDASRAA